MEVAFVAYLVEEVDFLAAFADWLLEGLLY
jgi:hypothetical protein